MKRIKNSLRTLVPILLILVLSFSILLEPYQNKAYASSSDAELVIKIAKLYKVDDKDIKKLEDGIKIIENPLFQKWFKKAYEEQEKNSKKKIAQIKKDAEVAYKKLKSIYKDVIKLIKGTVKTIEGFNRLIDDFGKRMDKIKKETDQNYIEVMKSVNEANRITKKLNKDMTANNKRIQQANKQILSSMTSISNGLKAATNQLNSANKAAEKNINQMQKHINRLKNPKLDINPKLIHLQNVKANIYTSEIHLSASTSGIANAGKMYSGLMENFITNVAYVAPGTGDVLALSEVLSGKTLNGTSLTNTDIALNSAAIIMGPMGRTGKVVNQAQRKLLQSAKKPKFTSKKENLTWLEKTGNRYTAYEVKGTVTVAKKVKKIDRRVYRMNNIDWNYKPKKGRGKTNLELAKGGYSPYDKDGSMIELHHSIQKEPGAMIELSQNKHTKFKKELHGIIKTGQSFRNNPILEKQYNNFKKNYWKSRAQEILNKL
ncbi:Ribonuclease YobL [Bacillus safensis]|uniref:HNH/ENDO VII family nuclease n=1 Tax=Bacillus safensis TaxID=561879 RepID=UPI0006A83699|nr:HNH/ENDO VII family nuclease [Bacillus safensis]CUB19043.1 Ribonuclease YobL [Bacillus safensis]